MTFDWIEFRQSLTAALEAGSLSVALDSAKAPAPTPGRDALLIGVGKPAEDAGPNRIVLNNKGQARWYSSVARLMAEFPETIVAQWAPWRDATDRSPAAALPRLHLIVEDASPDSMIGAVYFLARFAGAETQDLPSRWTEAADRWECSGDAPDPFRSWPPLCSALGHSYFLGPREKPKAAAGPSEEKRTPEKAAAVPPALPEDELVKAWTGCLRLTVEAIAAGCDPNTLPPDGLTDIAEARAAVEAEQDTYREALVHALKMQLFLPLARNTQRRVLVDGIVFLEEEPAGVKKLFVRRDRENAPLGKGFAFMGVYRSAPEMIGSGNDIVFSLDTARGLTLEHLWSALEAGETAAWGASRPTDDPRKNMQHPLTLGNVFNQPWYLTKDGSLVAAPRFVTIDGEQTPGRKLSWSQVLDLLWETYNPARFITVVPYQEQIAKPLLACGGVVHYGKRLIIAQYASPAQIAAGEAHEPPGHFYSLPVRQSIAAMLRPDDAAARLSLENLPALTAFDLVDMPGGHAIVSSHGCFLFDDWNAQSLDIAGCAKEMEHAAHLAHQVDEARRTLEGLSARAQAFLRAPRDTHPEDILHEVSQLKVQLAHHRVTLATPPAHSYLRVLRARLDERFGSAQMLGELQAQARDIEEAVRSLQTTRSQSYFDIFALYATPIFILVSLTSPVGDFLQGAFGLNKGWDLLVWAILALLAIAGGRLFYAWIGTAKAEGR
jgi:hypothetical protein